MRGNLAAWVLVASILAGCSQQEASNSTESMNKSPGRYAGIGTFDPGRLWTEQEGATASKDPKAATLSDDEHVIVVLDSHTGEVRQCGDHSGFCVAMNPWSAPGSIATAPVKLAKHASDLDAEAEGKPPKVQSTRGNALNEAAPAQ